MSRSFFRGHAGVLISIGTDSHHPWQLEFLELGLAAALAAGIPEERILNFKTAKELVEWARDRWSGPLAGGVGRGREGLRGVAKLFLRAPTKMAWLYILPAPALQR